MVESVFQLKCGCNNLPWGKKGEESLSARYASMTPGTDFMIESSEIYAEMWMGTYPDLPSYVLSSGEDLQDVLDKNHELIGKKVIDKFGHTMLPFLPKVLSIQKALPLQTHPNKELAAKLHEKDPSNFTDPNHKPEIAIALSKFEAFCGFLPIDEINILFNLAPLQHYKESKDAKLDDKAMKKVVLKILTDSDENIAEVQEKLKSLPKSDFGSHSYIPEVLPRLQEQYDKTDPGNLVALFTMNFMTLSPGESIFIPADGIHAYLSGDIIECMARSNNVLNTGFCPRAERNSADMFVDTLTFKPHSIKEAMLPSSKFEGSVEGKTVIYDPPMSEFSMLLTTLEGKEKETLKAVQGPSVMIVTKGAGKMQADGKSHELGEGYVFFIGQGQDVTFETDKKLEVYRAYVE